MSKMEKTNKKKKTSIIKKVASKAVPILTVKNVTKAIKDSAGIYDVIAKRLNCSRSWLHQFINNHSDLVELRKHERERFVDMAESKLVKKVREESDWAIKYTLSTLGKNRGFAEKAEINHTGLEGIKISFAAPSEERQDNEEEPTKPKD